MKHAARFLLIVTVMAAATPSVPAASLARSATARPAAESATAPGAPTQQSWWGKAAGYLCRGGFRYVGTPVFHMWTGFCVVALLDVID